MANKRIKDLTQTATTLASDDYVAIDGPSNGTRKIVKGDLVNDISSQVAGTYLDEANNLSDVASLDTSKLNLEVPDVGTAPNEVPLNGMLGDMAYQSSDGVSAAKIEVETLEVTDNLGVIPTGTDINPGIVSKVGAFLSSNSEVGIGFSGFPSGDGANKSAIIHERKDTYGRGDLHICSNYDADATNANKSDAVITVDGSTGSVGIGTASPGSLIHVKDNGDSSNDGGIQIERSTGSTTAFFNMRGGRVGFGSMSSVPIKFYVNGDNKWTIGTNGNLTAVASGAAIDFGSTNTNTGVTVTGSVMSEYEQGTFTPKLADAATGGNVATYSTNAGDYIRVGNQVFFALRLIDINTTGLTSGNTIYITDMPYQCKSGSSFVPCNVMADSLTFTGQVTATLQGGVSYLILKEFSSGGADASLTVSAISSGVTDLFITGSYLVA